MAREGDGTTDKRITYTLSAGGRAAFDAGGTWHIHINPDTDGGGSNARCIDTANTANAGGYLGIITDDGTNANLQFQQRGSGTAGLWVTANKDLTLNVWQTAACVYDDSATTNDPLLYTNGVSGSVTESATPTGTLANAGGNIVLLNNYSSSVRQWDGDIMMPTIWNIAIPAAQLAAISRGANPFFICGTKPVFHSPTFGNDSPEGEYITSANTGTVTASTKSIPNPPTEMMENFL